ncbi:MAG: hypothetical protein ACQESP_06845 [Candidatus Muiribacteriota bacterium]
MWSKKYFIILVTLFFLTILPHAIADYIENENTAFLFMNSVVYDQTGNTILDFSHLYDIEDQFPTGVYNSVRVTNPEGGLGCNFNDVATIDDGGSAIYELPYFPYDARELNIYFRYRRREKKSKGKGSKWVYYDTVERIKPSKEGIQTHTFSNQNSRGGQEIILELRGKELVIKNHGKATTKKFLWWNYNSKPLPMYLQVIEMKGVKIPRAFPKIGVDGNDNIYNVLRKKGRMRNLGDNKFARELILEVYKNGSQKLFEIVAGEEEFQKTGPNAYNPVGDQLHPHVNLDVNPQGTRVYLTSDTPSTTQYIYHIDSGELEEKSLGFSPEHMTVSTKNREEEWLHYGMADGLSIAETWGPQENIEDSERFELYDNTVYKTTDMYDIFNNEAEDGGYVNLSTKDVYGSTLQHFAVGEDYFAYSDVAANTSANFALGDTPDTYTAMGRRATMTVNMGVEITDGEEIIILERSNGQTHEHKWDAQEEKMRFTTDEAEDYRITRDGKLLIITDVGSTPTITETRRRRKWRIWPIWWTWEYYTVEVPDPVLNDPTNFGLTAFYNIASVCVTEVPYEDIQYFAADGYGNKYTIRRTFEDYENWRTDGQVTGQNQSTIRHGQMTKFYRRETNFTLYSLDSNNNQTELFTFPNVGYSYYYRLGSPIPPGSCGCRGIGWSDYRPIYEAAADADLATNSYAMPPRVVGTPLVDIEMTQTDSPKLQMLGITGELFMDIDENRLISSEVAPANNVVFENYDGVEWGHKFLGEISAPDGKRSAPAGIINQYNPYIFEPNEYYFRYNVVEEINKDIDGDGNYPDGAQSPSHRYANLDWAVTGGGFPSHVVLGRHMNYSENERGNPLVDSRYYVWSMRRLGIYNPNQPEGEELVNAETPWTIINHGARDYTDNQYAKQIMQQTGMDFVPDESMLNQAKTSEGFRFQPEGYRFDDGGVYEIMLASGYRYIDWEAMRDQAQGGNLRFWWDEPDYIAEAPPMKPDITRVIVRAFEPEDRPNLLEVVIDGETTDAPDYDEDKMMSNWQYFDHDGNGIPDSAVVEINEDFEHKWTAKIIQKDRFGNIVSDNDDILFVPNREGQQEIRDQIMEDDPYTAHTEENLDLADKFSGIAFESSGGTAMHYEWEVETIVDDQVFSHNYYNNSKRGNMAIDNPALDGHNINGSHYQPEYSRVQEEGYEDFIYGEDGSRRPSYFETYFDKPIVPNHYRITYTLYYTRIDYFDEEGNFAYPLTDEHGQVIGYDCKESIEKSEFYVDVYVKDTTLPQVRVETPILDGGTTGDPFPREIRAYITDNNPFDGLSELEYNDLKGTSNNTDFAMIPPGTRAHLLYPRRLDPERTPADVFEFEEIFEEGIQVPSNNQAWKWERPNLNDDPENAYLKVTDVLTAYEAPGIQTASYEVVLTIDEEDLKLLMPFDAVTNDNYGSFKYLVVAEDGSRNYYENHRDSIPVRTNGGYSTTTFQYQGDSNAQRQFSNVVHFEEEDDYIERQTYGVPKTMREPGMLSADIESFISQLELNTIYPRQNAGTLFEDDEGEFEVYKQAGGPPTAGYYGMDEGEIIVEDNDPPEVYLRITNPKRNITIGYYLYNEKHVDGVSGDDDRMRYPFRDETEYDENIPGLLALSDESDRGNLFVAVGGGDAEVYQDPEIVELPHGYPEIPEHMVSNIRPWFGEGFASGGGLTGGISDSADFYSMLYDFEDEHDINTLFIEEDMRIRIELAAVDNVNNPAKSDHEESLNLTLAGEYNDDMVNYLNNNVNSAMYITNAEDDTGNTPRINWHTVSDRTESGRISDYFIFRESTREDAPDEHLYVRIKDNSDNEVAFRIPVRILNVRVLERKIHEMRQQHNLGD